jgi:hypothetical protein
MWIYSTIVAIAISFFAGWYVNGLRLNAEIAQLHATWNEAYNNQSMITVAKEHNINLLNNQIEVNNAAKEKELDAVHADNLKLATTIKRLQQSASASSSTMPSPNNSCQCTGTAAQSEFSTASIGLLVQMAREADEAAKYASTCHEWAVGTAKELAK